MPDPHTRPQGETARPAPRGRLGKAILALGALGLVTLVAAYAWFQYAINQPIASDAGQTFVIKRGETLGQVARRLEDDGYIKETLSLRLLARKQGNSHQVRAGEYRFPDALTVEQLLDNIVSGRNQVGVSITIIEGWTFRQMRAALAAESRLQQTTADMTDDEIMAALGYPDLHPEGQFFPDTYYYHAGEQDLSIFRKAFALMQDNLERAWSGRHEGQLLESPQEALILASIIEKETQALDEQALISGVFHNRLRKGMRLQTDPTVIYGLGESFDGNITRKHLKTDNPYNTYTRNGLTPTPISLPSMSSLVAAVQPAETDAYYFVARGGGRHKFSETLEEHNAAVRKYILKKGDG